MVQLLMKAQGKLGLGWDRTLNKILVHLVLNETVQE